MRTKKRTMWIQVCSLFTVLWALLGLVFWPSLLLAVCSALMMMIPVGVTEDAPQARHNPNAWRQHNR